MAENHFATRPEKRTTVHLLRPAVVS